MRRKRDFNIIVTLGPSILDEKKLKAINRLGKCIYRINGAHVSKEQAGVMIDRVRLAMPGARFMMCLPGNKIRTVNLSEPIRLIKGERFKLHNSEITYPPIISRLKKGDIVLASDSVFTFEVSEIARSFVRFFSHSDGLLYSNKGLNIKGIHGAVPFLFDKDRELIGLARSLEVDFLALSFVRTAGDVREAKKMLSGSRPQVIAKIETLSAMKNLEKILGEVDSILIDRGDLSAEVGILELAAAQDRITDAALRKNKDVYLATHFLKNMETKPIPLIPEIIDLVRTLKTGIAGIQLSEETAIGKYPVECVKLIFDAVNNKA